MNDCTVKGTQAKTEAVGTHRRFFVVSAIGFLYYFSINFEGLRLRLTMREA